MNKSLNVVVAVAVVVVIFSSCSSVLLAQADGPGMVGPLVGHTTDTSATLWMYAPNNAKVEVAYRETAVKIHERRSPFTPVADPASQGASRPFKVTLTKLRNNHSYDYRIFVNGKLLQENNWTFKTAPVANKPAKFKIGLTSCMRIGKPLTSWKIFEKAAPDLHLTVGDTHYADSTNPKKQWQHHVQYRKVPQFASVIRRFPTYSIWDDHDYGPNNSDGTAKGKENSLKGWNQFWANPKSGTSTTPGAFYTFHWGDVQVFMVDSRYHRSPDKAPDDKNKRMIGDAQFKWLIDGLTKSKAKFKVIASGSTLNHSGNDGWRIYTHARHRFFDAIKKHRIGGVVYMAGDIHRSLVWEHHESKRVGYPLVEVISSGIANSKTLSFATVEFDTTKPDPTMQVRITQGDGKTSTDKTWKLSDLQVK
jgi:alkaline phosphatase D